MNKKKVLPSKEHRIKYALCTCGNIKHYIEQLMPSYGWNIDRSWYDNEIIFVNTLPKHKYFEAHRLLVENGEWPYDDKEDWQFTLQDSLGVEDEISRDYDDFKLKYKER
jgi:hypothetical protein